MTDSGTLLSLIRQVRAQRHAADALDAERLRLEGSLIEFVEEAWPFIDAAPYQPSWAIDALCEHLQAVTEGRISRLLINFPPRCGKTIITGHTRTPVRRKKIGTVGGARLDLLHSPGERCYPSISGESCRVGT
jgi:hypothetical protein